VEYDALFPNLFTGWPGVHVPYTAPKIDEFVSNSALWNRNLRWNMMEDTSVHYSAGTETLFPQPPRNRSVQYPTISPFFPRDEMSSLVRISQNTDITARGKVSTPSMEVIQ